MLLSGRGIHKEVRMRRRVSPKYMALAVLCAASAALAQTGTLDQSSPQSPSSGGSASYNADASFLIWQAQIRPGLSGQLEGIRVTFNSATANATFNLRVRDGAAPSSNAPVFETVLTAPGNNQFVTQFVDMTSANFNITAGSPFVMEVQGNNQGCWIIGSYVDPNSGPPLYPEPLYLNGSRFVPGWRIGFDTFVLAGSSCDADFNGDTVLDLFDYLDFVAAFAANVDTADYNGDTIIDLFDYLDFVADFAEGCD
jgi:hypothetical protein